MARPTLEESLVNPLEAIQNESWPVWTVPTPTMARRDDSFRRSCSMGSSSMLLQQIGAEEEAEYSEECGEMRGSHSPQPREPILRVVVEISPTKPQSIIMVQEGDDIERLAEQFVQDNGLPLELAIPLAEKIHEDLRLLGHPSGTVREESEEDKIEFDLRGVEHRSSPVLRVPSPNEDSPPLGSAPRRRPLTAVPTEPDKRGDEGGGRWRASGDRLWSGVRSRGRGGLRSGLGGRRRPPAKAASKKKPEQGAERSSSVFTKLHEHAEIKRQRLVKLKEQLEDETKSQSPRRRPKVTRQPDSPGHRLYRMHERKIRNLVNLQRDHVAEREEAELRGVTFKPAIDTSQRVWPGVSRLNRSMADSADVATRPKWKDERAARLSSEIEEQRMKECSFMPHINHQSLLIAQRRNPFRKNRSPFETLYQDALQRKVRREQWKSYLPEEATFAPDIGSAHDRPSNDETKEMFFRRLSSSKRAASPRPDSLASHGAHPHGALRDGHCVLRQPTASRALFTLGQSTC
ncbi:hypothetical protein FOZ62_002076 [Perkinsus olseni]|uniref:Uncharacterized protein n=1 Tax=Perkinsus olseni TaxID=32597 RepID=A0A7J6R5S0_PEROL|nr:hypothetical protein FOZ62_002076 [Perkinsus olseni]